MLRPIRAFIAITPPADVIRHLRELQDRLQADGVQARWVRPERIHLTLRFLGDIDSAQIGAISAAMAAVASQSPPFDLATSCLGGFPNRRKPRVIWVGIHDPASHLQTVAQGLEDRLAPLIGQRERRPFTGHLTLARAKGRRPIDLAPLAGAEDQHMARVAFRVRALMLYESRLGPGGAVYRCLREAGLEGSPSPATTAAEPRHSNSSTVWKP
jgi:2'-5' RNA ligase